MKNGVTKFARRFCAAREESVTTDFSVFAPQLAECVPNRFTLYGTLFFARVTNLLRDQSGSKDRTKARLEQKKRSSRTRSRFARGGCSCIWVNAC